MPNQIINRRIVLGNQGITYEAESIALFNQWNTLGTPATDSRKIMVNNTIVNLKSSGIWTELDYLYIWASHSRSAALVDWKNPATRVATVVNPHGADFVVDSYFKGNGSNFRIDLGFNPGDGGTYKFTQNSNSFGVYMNTHVAEAKADFGNWSAGSVGNDLFTSGSVGAQSATDNSGTQRTITTTGNARGLSSVKRTASNVWEISKNGYDNYAGSSTQTDVSQALNNLSFQEFCRNTNGTYSQFTTRKHGYSFAGSGAFTHFTLHNIIDKYWLTPLAVSPTKRAIFNGNSFNSALAARVILDLNLNDSVEYLIRGISGKTTVELHTDAATSVFNRLKPFLVNEVYVFTELTNDFFNVGSNVTTAYNNLVSMLQDVRTYFPSRKIGVSTCMPRQESGSFINANRQNDLNLLDNNTLNGRIRNHLVQDGYADFLIDMASDGITIAGNGMGVYSQGVPGVGEKNTTWYSADEIHPTTAGYNYLADTYYYPAILSYL